MRGDNDFLSVAGTSDSSNVVIDSHQHYWRIEDGDQEWRRTDQPDLARDYLPSHLMPELDSCGVGATVLVQSVNSDQENERILRIGADRRNRVGGVVAWMPLARDPDASRLDQLFAHESVRGVRDLCGRANLSPLLDPARLRLLRKLAGQRLAWDVVPVGHAQRRVTEEIARAVPDLRIVVDHLGRPPLPERGWEPWASDMRRLAVLPQVRCKLSVGIDVLQAWESWSRPGLGPYLRWIVEAFGPDRVMWASNWPVSSCATTYEQSLATVRDELDAYGLSRAEMGMVLGGTARQCYRLAAPETSGGDRTTTDRGAP